MGGYHRQRGSTQCIVFNNYYNASDTYIVAQHDREMVIKKKEKKSALDGLYPVEDVLLKWF